MPNTARLIRALRLAREFAVDAAEDHGFRPGALVDEIDAALAEAEALNSASPDLLTAARDVMAYVAMLGSFTDAGHQPIPCFAALEAAIAKTEG